MSEIENITAEFRVEKVTKNTVRFEEILPSEFAMPKIGTLYVPKASLAELGYREGLSITVTIAIGRPVAS